MHTASEVTILFRIFSRAVASLISISMLTFPLAQQIAVSQEAKGSPVVAPLSLEQVVDSLVRKNEERSRNLLHAEATRVYHLTYRGFPGNRDAEMTVEASYDSPAHKEFKIVSQSGSKLILDRVFAKLLEAEEESARPEIASQTQLNTENYEFAFVVYDPQRGQYELQVTPRHKRKYLYQGTIWVDAADFAVTRIEAEPAQNPSFWTKKSEIHHLYQKVQNSWVPAKNESISYIRLGGRATLTIEYKDYRLIEAHSDLAAVHMSAEPVATLH